jgi:hypothetical protein
LQIRGQLPQEGPGKLFVMGASTSLLNPKLAMIFLTLLPQFIDHQRGDVLQQSLLLGSLLITVFALVNGSMALFSGRIAHFLASRPAWLLVQRLLMGGRCLLSVRKWPCKPGADSTPRHAIMKLRTTPGRAWVEYARLRPVPASLMARAPRGCLPSAAEMVVACNQAVSACSVDVHFMGGSGG